jgi:hypothetical protein
MVTRSLLWLDILSLKRVLSFKGHGFLVRARPPVIARAVSTLLKRSLRPFVFTATREREAPTALPGLGVYVHIPFCRSICSFCPYYKVRYRAELVPPFVDALEREILSSGADERIPAASVSFGGGTPAVLAGHLPRIRSAIDKAFDVRGPWGIELHPDDVDDETVARLRAAGVTMVSLGVQSFQPESLKALGRSPADLASRFDTVRRGGFSVIDVDLIFGIPGQTPASISADVRTAVDHGATRSWASGRVPRRPLPTGARALLAVLAVVQPPRRPMRLRGALRRAGRIAVRDGAARGTGAGDPPAHRRSVRSDAAGGAALSPRRAALHAPVHRPGVATRDDRRAAAAVRNRVALPRTPPQLAHDRRENY